MVYVTFFLSILQDRVRPRTVTMGTFEIDIVTWLKVRHIKIKLYVKFTLHIHTLILPTIILKIVRLNSYFSSSCKAKLLFFNLFHISKNFQKYEQNVILGIMSFLGKLSSWDWVYNLLAKCLLGQIVILGIKSLGNMLP